MILMLLFIVGSALYGLGYLLWGEKKDATCKIINEVLQQKLKIKNDDSIIFPSVESYNSDSKCYFIDLPSGFEFKQLLDLKGFLENALKSEIKINNENFRYSIQLVERKAIPTLIPFKIIDTKQEKGLKVAVAIGAEGIVYFDFAKVPHVLVAGATGWGKSIFTKNLILQILNNFPSSEFELIDLKSGIELGIFKDLEQTKSFIIRPHEAENEISRIYDEIEDRFSMITAAKARDIFEYNQRNREKMPYKFVVIEEFTILLDQSKEMSKVLTKSLAIARAAGVYFIFTSQRFSADIIDSKIKANIDNRVCFHVADSTNSKIILDVSGAEKITTIGRALISQGGIITEAQTPYVKKEDVERIVKTHISLSKPIESQGVIKGKGDNKKSSHEPKEGEMLWV